MQGVPCSPSLFHKVVHRISVANSCRPIYQGGMDASPINS